MPLSLIFLDALYLVAKKIKNWTNQQWHNFKSIRLIIIIVPRAVFNLVTTDYIDTVRNVVFQVDDLNATLAPVFIQLLRSNMPPAVKMTIKPVRIYSRSRELNTIYKRNAAPAPISQNFLKLWLARHFALNYYYC